MSNTASNRNPVPPERDLPIPDDFERGFDVLMPTPEPRAFMEIVGQWSPYALVGGYWGLGLALLMQNRGVDDASPPSAIIGRKSSRC